MHGYSQVDPCEQLNFILSGFIDVEEVVVLHDGLNFGQGLLLFSLTVCERWQLPQSRGSPCFIPPFTLPLGGTRA